MKLDSFRPGDELQFPFVNYRGERETRHVLFLGMSFGSNRYYPEPQWLFDCWDVERGERRGFGLGKIDPATIVRLNHNPVAAARSA